MTIEQAIKRHKALQAAIAAWQGCIEDQSMAHLLFDAETEALDQLAFTPCVNDAEFIKKLQYLYVQQSKNWDLPDHGDNFGCIVIAAACHFYPLPA